MYTLLNEATDNILDGIDRGDASVILEAVPDFEAGLNTMKGYADDLASLFNDINASKLKILVDLNKGVLDKMNKIKMGDLPDDFSYKAAMALRTGKGDEATSITPVMFAASKVDTAVNGAKDAILVIAEWMEGYPEIFGISSAGVEIKAPFDKNLDELSLAAIAGKSGLEIAKLFAGPQMGSDATDEEGKPVTDEEEQVYAHYREGIDALAEKTKKETAQATSDFLSSLEAMGKELAGIHQSCVKAITEVEVPPELGPIVKSQGWFKKLFSGDTEFKVNQKEAVGICGSSEKDMNQGLFSLNMSEFGALVGGLINIVQGVSDATIDLADGVAKQGEDVMEPSDEQAQALEDTAEALGGDKDKAGEFLARLEDKDLIDPENPVIEDVDEEEVEEVVTDMGANEDKVPGILDLLFGRDTEEDEGGGYKEDLLKDVNKRFKDYTNKWAEDNEIRASFNSEEMDKLVSAEQMQKIMDETEPTPNGLIPKDEFDEEPISDKWQISPQEIAVGMELAENKTFSRWGVLAGIIKG